MIFERSDEDDDLEFEEDSEQDEKARTFSCNKCAATFNSSFDFEVHLNKGHANADANHFDCSTCGQTFNSQSGLESHACKNSDDNWTVDDKTECNLCGRFVKHLGQHLSRFHKQRSNSQSVTRQRSNVVNTKQCSQCPKKFKSNSDRERHENGVHSKGRFPCEICGTILTAKTYLIAHMRRVHRILKNDLNLTEFDEFNSMKNEHHKDPTEKSYCDICDRHFKERRYLRQHMRNVHNEKLSKQPEESKGFDCEYCDKSLGSEYNLQRHIQVVHKKDQLCKCEVCGATFARLRSLNQHKEKVHDLEMERGILNPMDDCQTSPSKSAWSKVFSRNVKAERELDKPKQQILSEDLTDHDYLKSKPILPSRFQVAPNQSIKKDYDAFQPPTTNVTFKCVNCDYKAFTQMDIIKHNIFRHTQ